MSVIDVTRGRLVQAIAADVAVTEVAFTARTAFLLRADQAGVGAVHVAALGEGEPATVREIMLGRPWAEEPPEGGWMAAFSGGGELVVVHAESYSGFILHDNPAMSDRSWPMSRVHLRGGEPRRVAVLDRSLRETSPGVFAATAVIPETHAGWELVLTTGLGGRTVCAELPTAVPVATGARGPGAILVETVDGATGLRLEGPDGSPAADLLLRLTFSAPQSNWRRSVRVRTDADGHVVTRFRLPDLHPMIVTADAPDPLAFHPLVLEE